MTTDILGTHGGCWSEGVTERGSENRLDGGQSARCEELGGVKVEQEDSAVATNDDHSDEHASQDTCIRIGCQCEQENLFVDDTHPVV